MKVDNSKGKEKLRRKLREIQPQRKVEGKRERKERVGGGEKKTKKRGSFSLRNG